MPEVLGVLGTWALAVAMLAAASGWFASLCHLGVIPWTVSGTGPLPSSAERA